MLSFAWWKDGRRHRKPLILAACLQGACNEWGFGAGGTGVILAVSVRAPPAVCRAAGWRARGSSCCEGAGAAHGSGTPAGKGVGSWPEGPCAPVLGVTLAVGTVSPALWGWMWSCPMWGSLSCSACTHVTRHRDRNAWARSEVPGAGWRCWGHSRGDTMSGWKTRASLLLPGTIPSTGKPRPASLGVGEFL